jgi:hypothetical protein
MKTKLVNRYSFWLILLSNTFCAGLTNATVTVTSGYLNLSPANGQTFVVNKDDPFTIIPYEAGAGLTVTIWASEDSPQQPFTVGHSLVVVRDLGPTYESGWQYQTFPDWFTKNAVFTNVLPFDFIGPAEHGIGRWFIEAKESFSYGTTVVDPYDFHSGYVTLIPAPPAVFLAVFGLTGLAGLRRKGLLK